MRASPVFAALIVLALPGCGDTPAEPYTPSGPPPSGLAATLIAVRPTPGVAPPRVPSVVAAGDSIVVTAVLRDECVNYSVAAGVAKRVLVITVVDSMPVGLACAAVVSGGPFRAVVRSAPRGRYQVALRARLVGAYNPRQERELLRRVVSLP
jgi:hypothetical protein